ncbi:MAG: ribosomal L7Ae/L30e/S12e/Gadd45 family protein [Oscillospiraceae bacterium]|jgi:large subunit ribosomal protein L7A|nr:ribosomal L7Ae/L30e/S12e/Gadd45 family protein [Oscillospiraceae bacterium]
MDRLIQSKARVAGSKQVLRALGEGTLATVYVARDADPFVTRRVVLACEKARVPVIETDSMVQLGRVCGLQVKAAAAGILK